MSKKVIAASSGLAAPVDVGYCRCGRRSTGDFAITGLAKGALLDYLQMSCNCDMEKQDVDQLATDVEAGWRRRRGEFSLADVHRSIAVGRSGPTWRRAIAFLGPGYLVAVGYMDPGNWATSLAGGSKFGYTLLVVALVSNIMAIVLQALCARLAIASGRDLAQACRDAYPALVRPIRCGLLAEIAIIATDIAEVIGTAIGLNLLFGIPLEIGVLLTALDVFLILYLQRAGLPLARGADHHAARRHRRLLRRADRAGRPGMGRGDPRLRADHARSSPTRTCSIWPWASSAPR